MARFAATVSLSWTPHSRGRSPIVVPLHFLLTNKRMRHIRHKAHQLLVLVRTSSQSPTKCGLFVEQYTTSVAVTSSRCAWVAKLSKSPASVPTFKSASIHYPDSLKQHPLAQKLPYPSLIPLFLHPSKYTIRSDVLFVRCVLSYYNTLDTVGR